ncbi:MAG TPA: M23 family metallopeptidase [Gemmatimonadota bacterium]|nr:M23 family metallopeptidase [Gemmatimonadota bacterium]
MRSGGRGRATIRLAVFALSASMACAPVYSRTTAPGPAVPSRPVPGGGEAVASGLSGILGRLIWPLAMDGVRVLSSPYGTRLHPRSGGERFHRGLDLRADEGTPVYAVADGRVSRSGWSGAYGNLILLDHGEGLESVYGHHSRNLVAEGESVRRGEVIALVGHTGNATGDHLHFELRWRGGTVDPWRVLPALYGARGR